MNVLQEVSEVQVLVDMLHLSRGISRKSKVAEEIEPALELIKHVIDKHAKSIRSEIEGIMKLEIDKVKTKQNESESDS